MKIVFIGSDMRMQYACDYISRCGYDASIISFNNDSAVDHDRVIKTVHASDVIVLPAPVSNDGINIRGTESKSGSLKIADVIENVKSNSVVFAGKLSEALIKKINYINYLEDEEYLLDSAYLTAEGTLGHLLSEYPKALAKSSIVLTGWGRIAKYLYKQLESYTKNITVVLRNQETAKKLIADNISVRDFSYPDKAIKQCDILINTVPAGVITRETLSKLDKDTYIIDLASLPGGVDFDAAKEFGITCKHLLALPGKCAPVSAGYSLGKCLHNRINNLL